MIVRTGSVTFHSDGVKVEGFHFANITSQEQAEIEVMQWVIEKIKAYRDAKMKSLGRRLVLPQ